MWVVGVVAVMAAKPIAAGLALAGGKARTALKAFIGLEGVLAVRAIGRRERARRLGRGERAVVRECLARRAGNNIVGGQKAVVGKIAFVRPERVLSWRRGLLLGAGRRRKGRSGKALELPRQQMLLHQM